jgi:ribonuclease HII
MPEPEHIAGIDEAGRGALAGPVVAGACLITCELFRRRGSVPWWSPDRKGRDIRIADSKQLTPEERSVSFAWICSHMPFGVGIVSQEIIDAKGILFANQLAMRRALHMLRSKTDITRVLVDGKDAFTFDLPHASIIRGDQTEANIAAASIVAKVTRDRLMCRAERIFPGYGFDEHKGYGTEPHRRSLSALGVSALHRKTFVKTFLSEQLSFI